MRIRQSLAIAAAVSVSAIALAFTTDGKNHDSIPADIQNHTAEYASAIHQSCSVCNEVETYAAASDSMAAIHQPCPICGGSGEITATKLL